MATSTLPHSNLPIWMRRALRKTDWAGLISIAFSLLIALPVLFQPGLPRTNDSEHYVFQTENTAAALQEGRGYPRWAPHALAGYGAPIPNYYPQGAAYLAALTEIVIAGDPVAAVQIVYALALTLAGVTMYALVARRAGAAAGLVANLLYSFSPYVGLIAPHVQGDLPAVICLWLLPALLWSLDRLMSARLPFDFAIVSLVSAGLILVDLRFAVAGFCLGALLVAWHADSADRQPGRWRTAAWALGLGVCLSAFFWLPALIEHNAVRWDNVTTPIPARLALTELIAPLLQPDPSALVPSAQWTLGTPLALFSLLAAALLLFRRARLTFQALFLVLGAIAILIGLLLAPDQTWLLGIMTLCLSIGASSLAEIYAVAAMRRRGWLLTLLCTVIVAAALPIWLYPYPNEPFGSAAPAAQVEYELQGFGIAALPAGAPLPTTLAPSLSANRALINGYRTGDIIKIDTVYLNSSVQVGFLEHTSHSDRLQVQTFAPTQFTMMTAYFPGWTASANSGGVHLSQDADTGLISIAFDQAATTELTIGLGPTPIRTIAWIVSWAALGAIGLITRTRMRHHAPFLADYSLLRLPETRAVSLLFVLVAATALLASAGALNGLRAAPGSMLDGSTTVRARTDSGLEMLSYRVDEATARPGDRLRVTLYWRAVRFLTENYRTRISLVDPATGTILATSDLRNPGNYPTRRWLTARIIRDAYEINLPRDVSAREAVVQVEAFICDAGCDPARRLTFFDNTGATVGQAFDLPLRVSIAP
ncbi:MAG: hypothetical protein IT320_01265 [Anaerolineae bacterium]|nr:hypothetical protein [Anaerolineae bacterium]